MGFRVVTAVVLADAPEGVSSLDWVEVSKFAPPEGFKFLATDDQQIVEPVLCYLSDKCLRNARIKSVGNTQAALVADLYEWFSYCGSARQRWDCVTLVDVEQYRDALLNGNSPLTGAPYSTATVRRRLSTILDFYNWARMAGLLDEGLGGKVFKRLPRNYDRDAMAHLRQGENIVEVRTVMPKQYRQDTVDAIREDDLNRILHELGPKLGDPIDTRPRRDRVIALLAVSTGMRCHECLGLTLTQFHSLRPDPTTKNYPLRLTVTKGGSPGTVIVPATVHEEIEHYVETERAAAVKALRRPAQGLFVNSATALNNPGGQLTTHTISRNFHAAVVRAGLTRQIQVNGSTVVKAAHTFHDLRHTFAVLVYFDLKKNGHAEPWLPLKNLLRHKHIRQTIDTYLRSVNTTEAAMTDLLGDYLRRLRDGS